MKRLLSLCLLLGCSQNQTDLVREKSQILMGESIGEYAQVKDENSLYTFLRSGTEAGLISIHLGTHEVKTLDREALQGKDLLRSGNWLAYRIESALRFMSKESNPFQLNLAVKKLRIFHANEEENFLLAGFDTSNTKSEMAVLNLSGEVLQRHLLPGSPREYFKTAAGKFLLLQTPKGFELWQAHNLETKNAEFKFIFSIHEGRVGSYSKLLQENDKFHLAYFHEGDGALFYKTFSLADMKPLQAAPEQIDGGNFENYRGMDISFFIRDEKIGLFYLDAWALKLRMAVREPNSWKATELSLPGATGFYTQVLEVTPEFIRIATHAFRSDNPDREQSFEDLWIAKIKY